MAIAVPSDTTRIFIDRPRLVQAMSPATLQGHLNDRSLNAEVFEMAGRIGIDCLTIELADVVPVLQQHGLNPAQPHRHARGPQRRLIAHRRGPAPRHPPGQGSPS